MSEPVCLTASSGLDGAEQRERDSERDSERDEQVGSRYVGAADPDEGGDAEQRYGPFG